MAAGEGRDLPPQVERARRVAQARLAGQRGRLKPRMLRLWSAASGAVAATSAGIGTLILAVTDSTGGDVIGGTGLVTAGVFGVSALAARRAARRADPRSAPSRGDVRRLARLPPPERVRTSELPRAVRGDWVRLIEARRLVDDLAAQGLVELSATGQIDDEIGRVGELLVADRRTSEMGGTSNARLRAQVVQLADLLVALADEAVANQAHRAVDPVVPRHVTEARERLVALREAREVIEGLDRTSPTSGDVPHAAPSPPPPRPMPAPPTATPDDRPRPQASPG